MRKALFLDRDGVINKEINYLYRIQDCQIIENIFPAIRRFHKEEYSVIIVTNQAGIAKGKYTMKDYTILKDWIHERFAQEGVPVLAEYMCPHHPDITGLCKCRKPESGLIMKAVHEWGISLENSVLVGDKETDIEAGYRAGIRRLILVRSGHRIFENQTRAHEIYDSLADIYP